MEMFGLVERVGRGGCILGRPAKGFGRAIKW